ncbi:ABC transporter substrate-binding protein [Antrihabitans sp. YC2-6]|uniref:ABC transporter substrate-binding protein n=1 Tax=Antrihabitans sp. YC2-6 TaxID=2799498 RepID=UPI0018F3E40F|nr:ABC transporter substrate-binding protein [Antrihabitans sp. YC2-6]MBJ8347655.1 ABC transporter substrate-binding protein [Antrihabitans sp. YC2-6]
MASTTRTLLPKAVVALAVAALLATSACSSDSSSSSDALNENLDGRGPITFVEGADTTGALQLLRDAWNANHPDEQVSLVEQSASATDQSTDFIENMKAERSDYDVLSLDVILTSDFAAHSWLQPLTGQFAVDTSKLLPAAVASGTYNNTLYAAPKDTGGGLLYYRTDLLAGPAPTTWSEMMAACEKVKNTDVACYAGQYAPYEGLTVNTAEAINSHGGTFVGPDGETPTVDSPEARAGLQTLVDGFTSGNIPAEAIQFKEDQGKQAFSSEKLMFLRTWPSVYKDFSADGSAVKDKFGIAPLPGVEGVGTSTIGGHNVGISAFSKNKATALDFIKFITGEEAQRILAEAAMAPVLTSLYDDQALIAEQKYLPVLKTSLENAVPRPVTPFYTAVSTAIYTNAYAALKNEKSVDQAITDMQAAIGSAGQ